MAKQRLMKEGLDGTAIVRIAESFAKTQKGFQKKRFINSALKGLDDLELKERVGHIITVLHNYLSADFKETAQILLQLKPNWVAGSEEDNLDGFAAWPVIDYVGRYGRDDPELSLRVLKELTPLFSAEFAIRPFLIEHETLTLKTLKKWSRDPDEYVRRLVSEGCRPRLPWGQRLPKYIKDPAPILPLLGHLKNDPSKYVRRSVANNLNDISKDHPEAVLELCRRWKKEASPEMLWLISHATRTLVKAGHPDVFELLGFTARPRLKLQPLALSTNRIHLGEAISFSTKIESLSKQPQNVVIDYAIHHVKANGSITPKVFKLRNLEIGPGETIELTKTHSLKPITTRKYYPGAHAIEILINGKTFGQAGFTLCLN